MGLSRLVNMKSNRIAQCHSVKIKIISKHGLPVQVDGEAWIQPAGFLQIVHKNRAQMLTRNKDFETTLRTWSNMTVKVKNKLLVNQITKSEWNALQSIVDSSSTLIKRWEAMRVRLWVAIKLVGFWRMKTASLKSQSFEQDLFGYIKQASSNLEEICNPNGKLSDVCLRGPAFA